MKKIRIISLLIIVTLTLMFFRAEASIINIIPSEVDFGIINPSLGSTEDFEVIVPVSLIFDKDKDKIMNLNILMSQPLTRQSDGSLLSNDRLLLKTDRYKPLTTTEPVKIISDRDKLSLDFKLSSDRFDSPGVYKAEVTIWEENTPEDDAVKISFKFEMTAWVQVKRAEVEIELQANGRIPGPDCYLTSSSKILMYISSNTNWVLAAYMREGFRSLSSYDYIIARTDLMIRTLAEDWLQPITNDFLKMGEKPVILSFGKPTGDWDGGWVPVRGEERLPFSRSQVAGKYYGKTEFIVVPED